MKNGFAALVLAYFRRKGFWVVAKPFIKGPDRHRFFMSASYTDRRGRSNFIAKRRRFWFIGA
jgi:hypothetical protein